MGQVRWDKRQGYVPISSHPPKKEELDIARQLTHKTCPRFAGAVAEAPLT